MEVLAIPRVGAAQCSGQILASPASGTVSIMAAWKGGGVVRGYRNGNFLYRILT